MPGVSPLREEGHRLLDVRRMTYTSVGWEVFYVKAAAVDWIKDPSSNLGLLMTVRTAHGRRLEDGVLRFAKRHQGHVNKQPILVVFSDDGRPSRETLYPTGASGVGSADQPTCFLTAMKCFRSQIAPEMTAATAALRSCEYECPCPAWHASTYARRLAAIGLRNCDVTGGLLPGQATGASLPVAVPNSDGFTLAPNPRSVRAAPQTSSSGAKSLSGGKVHDEPFGCTRHEMYVDFEKIGWSSWIISPKGYNAYHCKGQCYFPLGQNQWPTNHATVQSIVNELSLTAGVGAPCCVPNKLYSISLLYFDENENVVLKQYDDMVAASCGCH
ncbi:hypothetical protein HPB49_003857 [Dermacentor silvarum]|uniref:Uncharacterized protein n=1 Tax=Dermacentor silvarum TaxID=543639 RepID=A0ACB8DU91_DERSI|nr:hypothetical protein HPB49_003857 [Dermacentor silvarum]